jgi:hypothetical protein
MRAGETLEMVAHYVSAATGAGVTGIAVTVDYRNPAGTWVTGATAAEDGATCTYRKTVIADIAGTWIWVHKTADVTVAQQHIAGRMDVEPGDW